MTTYERGDVVLAPFPFSNQTATKKRPAVVVSSSLYNEKTNDIVIIAVTSKVEKHVDAGECLIADWRSAGLLKPSAVKPTISTIEQILVLTKLGSLSANDICKDLLKKERRRYRMKRQSRSASRWRSRQGPGREIRRKEGTALF